MKSYIAAAVLSLITAPVFSAELERAPELPDLSQFQGALHDVAAPAPTRAATQEAKAAACPIPDLNGALIGRGVFSMTYDVKVGEKTVGTISSEGEGYAFKDADGNLIAKTSPRVAAWGTKSDVTDCSGTKIGGIQEEYTKDGSNFTVSDAQGTPYANTGWTSSSSVSLKTAAGETVGAVTNASAFLDKFAISASPKSDGRVVALLGVLNTAAGYHRSHDNHADRDIEPHGGGRNR